MWPCKRLRHERDSGQMDDRVRRIAGERALQRFRLSQVHLVWKGEDPRGPADLARLSHAAKRAAYET